MDFFAGQDSLTSLQWILRAIIGFIFLVIIAKIMGQRSISQLRFLDFVVALLIGNIIAHPLSDEGLGLKGSMLTMAVVVFLYVSGVLLSIRWHFLRRLFDPSPMILIKDGNIIYKNLNKARITIDILMSELRKEKIEDPQKVALALFEPGGTISVFLQSQYQPITPKDLGLTTNSFELPKTVIKERQINYKELNQLGKNEQWLLNKIKTNYNANVDEVLLATIDSNDNLKVFFFGKR